MTRRGGEEEDDDEEEDGDDVARATATIRIGMMMWALIRLNE
jgi:hypothetical protein